MRSLPAAPGTGFMVSVVGAITWRAVVLTQILGILFALTPWLEQSGKSTQPNLPLSLAMQAATAWFVMVAALGADQAVRRGWTVWRAFLLALLAASTAAVLSQWAMNGAFGPPHAAPDLRATLLSLLYVANYWGVPLMVFLNRQSAARLLARVRGGELDRAQEERRLIASDLAAMEAQIVPAAVSSQLEQVRDLYEADNPAAEIRLDALIASLRDKVAQCARVS